jgi:membrane protein
MATTVAGTRDAALTLTRGKRPAVSEYSLVRIVDRTIRAFERSMAEARARSVMFDHVWRASDRFGEVLAGRLAAAISYYAFFAGFALAVLAYSILGRLPGTTGWMEAVNHYLSEALPWVRATADEVGRGELTAIGLVTLVLTGVGWVEALRSSIRAVWLLDQHPGHWLVRRLYDLAMLIGLGILLGLSLAITAAFDAVLDMLASDTVFGNTLVRSTGPSLAFVVNVILAAAVLAAVPRLRLSPRRLVPPALLIAVGIQILNTVGRWFIARTENRPAYQVVAGAVGLLVYLYLLNQLILFGAALAATSTRGTIVDLAATPAAADEAKHRDTVGEPPGGVPEKPR